MKIVNKLLHEIESACVKIAAQQLKDFSYENYVLIAYAEDPFMQPRECAAYANRLFASDENGDSVIRIFKNCRFGAVADRERIFQNARCNAERILCLMENAQYSVDDVEQIRQDCTEHGNGKRVALLCLFWLSPQLRASDAFAHVVKTNKGFAADCLDAILDLLIGECPNAISTHSSKSIEEYESELFKMDASLKRTERLLTRLQDEFDDRLEEYKQNAQIEFLTALNSSKYGHLLDLAVTARKGFKLLRQKKVDVPFEISATATLVRRILEFVEDCDVEPIMELDDEFDVNADEASRYTYEGTPFVDARQAKRVTVVATGWMHRQSEIVLSNPRVKELED